MGSSGALKVIGGISAASVTAIATGVGIDQNNKHQKALEEEKVRQEELDKKRALEEENRRILAKKKVFEEAKVIVEASEVGKTNWFGGSLYEFLDDQDIIFEIFKGKNGSEKLTENNFQLIPHQDLNISVKVFVSEKSTQLKTSVTGKVKIKHLKALKEDNDWTWTCDIKFTSFSFSAKVSSYELGEKDKFFNNKEDGFFDVLKKDLTGVSDETNKTKWKKIKKDFVKNCSDFSKKERKSIDSLATVQPTFSLRTKKDVIDTDNKLYFIYSSTDTTKENARTWFDEKITLLDQFGEIISS